MWWTSGWPVWLGWQLHVHLIQCESWQWLAVEKKDTSSVFHLMSVLMMRPRSCRWGSGISHCVFLFTPQFSWRLAAHRSEHLFSVFAATVIWGKTVEEQTYIFELGLLVSQPFEMRIQSWSCQPDIITLALPLLHRLMLVCFETTVLGLKWLVLVSPQLRQKQAQVCK